MICPPLQSGTIKCTSAKISLINLTTDMFEKRVELLEEFGGLVISSGTSTDLYSMINLAQNCNNNVSDD